MVLQKEGGQQYELYEDSTHMGRSSYESSKMHLSPIAITSTCSKFTEVSPEILPETFG